LRIAVVIPAFNEAESLPDVLKDLPEDLRIVVVDNGSTDATHAVAARAGVQVVWEPRRGYGTAVKAGLDALTDAPPEVVVICDADHSDPVERLPELLAPILEGGFDLVLSDRTLEAEPGSLTWVQILGNRFATLLIRLSTGHAYRDMGPFRCIRWDVLQKLHMSDPTWGWNVEMQMKAIHQGGRVVEVSLPYRCRRKGRSKISGSVTGALRAGYRILISVHRYRKGT
jgi:glycosyltransferase involved in cell wall biosynthesis